MTMIAIVLNNFNTMLLSSVILFCNIEQDGNKTRNKVLDRIEIGLLITENAFLYMPNEKSPKYLPIKILSRLAVQQKNDWLRKTSILNLLNFLNEDIENLKVGFHLTYMLNNNIAKIDSETVCKTKLQYPKPKYTAITVNKLVKMLTKISIFALSLKLRFF